MKLFLKISYLGTAYSGYQSQKNGISVQQMLNEATKKLFGFDCDVCGCSRTDKGVHANEFCLTVCEHGKSYLQTSVPLDNIVKAMNVYLPNDISVLSARWCEESFHARYSVASKEYIYRIYNSSVRSPFEQGRALHYERILDGEAIERMRYAAKFLEGKHDFSSFMSAGSGITKCERTIISTSIIREGDVVELSVRADGFLYNMVRIIVGTLLEVAEKKHEPEDILKIIEIKDRKAAGRTAPPQGLYLNKVFYEDDSVVE